MPAPPPESEPAIVRATGVRRWATRQSLGAAGHRKRRSVKPAGRVGSDVAEQLQARERGGRRGRTDPSRGGELVGARGPLLDQGQRSGELGIERRAGEAGKLDPLLKR